MLKISHYINLTQDQRYRLHEGEEIKLFGHMVPVWEIDNDTDEPAEEIFCVYLLKNEKFNAPIKVYQEGFEIMLPYREGDKSDISNEQWREWSKNEPEKLAKHYASLKKEVSSKNLLECKDGGKKSLKFREKCRHIINGIEVDVIHYINFKTMEGLLASLT